MAYSPTDWNEGAAPGISAANLDKIEQGIVDAHIIGDMRMGGDMLNFSSITTGFLTQGTNQFTLPSGWLTAEILAWGAVSFRGQNGHQARMTIGGSNGETLGVNLPAVSPTQWGTVGIRHKATVSGTTTILAGVRADVPASFSEGSIATSWIARRLT